MERLGTGIGWRPEIAAEIARLPGVDWVEVVAENICPGHLPPAVQELRERGTTVIPHGVSLGLGGADRPDPGRLTALAERAEALGAPLVTEHIAFVRAGGPLTASPLMEAGHLLPVPRTRDALDVLCENVRIAQDALPVPLALENIAALINWPDEEMTEGQFLSELVERTGVRLLIDVANLHTNRVNRGEDPAAALDELPVESIAYVHVAGGVERDGVWHDSHAHPVTRPVLDVLAELCARTTPPGVLLERDEDFPEGEELAGELDAIRTVLKEAGHVQAA
ncbi:endonuclease [Streptomyces natalensis ATCC 27448]|uniref:Endonuclease n=1 Tax=Streptomyces natalensis ATCC 27448 TaxID=1240678 RepID=A0A0D7CG28_9ACTN|nr:endonuclease [Streptomyces natalensis ATCC 27448]